MDPTSPRTIGPGWKQRGIVMRTGPAADFWNRYKEDFAHGQAMGLNAFRLSIEWARVSALDLDRGRNNASALRLGRSGRLC